MMILKGMWKICYKFNNIIMHSLAVYLSRVYSNVILYYYCNVEEFKGLSS